MRLNANHAHTHPRHHLERIRARAPKCGGGGDLPEGHSWAAGGGFGPSNDDFIIRTATLDEPEQGVSQAILDETDVLLWWGHAAHDQVLDETVTRVQQRVLAGMGLIVLHSGHWSKVFKRLMGTSCALCWREAGERERVWVVNPGHPIAAGSATASRSSNRRCMASRLASRRRTS
jgi:hypothetical protein